MPDLLLLAATVGAGLMRGYTGFGAGLVFLPIVSAQVGPAAAVATLFLLDLPISLPMLPDAFRRCRWREVLPLSLAACAVLPFGAHLLAHGDPVALRWALCLLVLFACLLLASGWRFKGSPSAARTLAVGGVAGLSGGAVGLGGPPVIAFWLAGIDDAAVARANIVAFFAFTTVAGALAYWWNGILNAEALWRALPLAPLYAVSLWLGTRAFATLPSVWFRRVALAATAAGAVLAAPL